MTLSRALGQLLPFPSLAALVWKIEPDLGGPVDL